MKKLHTRLGISAVSLLAIGGMASLGVAATHAEFSSSTGSSSPSYTLTSGTVHLTGASGDPISSTATAFENNMAPGDVTTHTFNLTYTGSLNAWMGVDTLVVSTIDNSASPGYGTTPLDFKYRVLNGLGTDFQKIAISANAGGDFNRAAEMTSCPATFDGVTVPSTLTVIDPNGGTKSAPTFCYLAETYVDPYWSAAGTRNSTSEALSNGGTQSEIGSWPAGNTTPVSQPLTIELGLCDGPSTAVNGTGGLMPDATHATCSNAVPNSYQGQAESVIVGAHAVAARNNVNSTNNGPAGSLARYTNIVDGGLPAGLSPTFPPLTPPAGVNWG